MTRVRKLVGSLVFVVILLAFGANTASADPGSFPQPSALLPDDPGYGSIAINLLPDDPGYPTITLGDYLLPDDPGYPN